MGRKKKKNTLPPFVQETKRVVVIVVGFTVLLFGFVLLFIPGPAIIVIPLGLAILATEFVWAKKLLDKAKSKIPKFKKPIKPQKPRKYIYI